MRTEISFALIVHNIIDVRKSGGNEDEASVSRRYDAGEKIYCGVRAGF